VHSSPVETVASRHVDPERGERFILSAVIRGRQGAGIK
jgi:hypothetical protein